MTSPNENITALVFGIILVREGVGLVKYVLDYVKNRNTNSGVYPAMNSSPLWQSLIQLVGSTHSQIEELRKDFDTRLRDIEEWMHKHEDKDPE